MILPFGVARVLSRIPVGSVTTHFAWPGAAAMRREIAIEGILTWLNVSRNVGGHG
jgi:hypothetical protein